MLSIATEEDDDEDFGPPTMGKRSSFMLSQSGTFQVSDFGMNRNGICGDSFGSTSLGATSALSSPITPGTDRDGSPSKRLELDVRSLDELQMLEELGQGASGTVQKAKHVPTGRFVAVKQIRILEKPKRDQMASEIRNMRKHESPWLVTMINAFYEDAKVYMVLELMDAGSLCEVVQRNPGGLRDERELAKISLQVLNGLNYLHRQHHQVHRDLKPGNVMLNSAGQVKISDFGISSQLQDTAGFCETFVGTTCYMAPERLSGGSYSYSADIWSFGLILLELALGSYPYSAADNYFKLLASIMDGEPPSLPEGDFSDEFAEFLSICLDKDPARRPSANDLLKHHWVRQHPMMDDLLLSGLEGNLLEMRLGLSSEESPLRVSAPPGLDEMSGTSNP